MWKQLCSDRCKDIGSNGRFKRIKEQIGLHQYQVRGWKAWHHHIATGDDGVAFHFGNANRKCCELAVNVVRGCEIDFGKYLEKQTG